MIIISGQIHEKYESYTRNKYEREGQEFYLQGAGGFGLGAKPFSESAPCSSPLALRHWPGPFHNRKGVYPCEDNNFP